MRVPSMLRSPYVLSAAMLAALGGALVACGSSDGVTPKCDDAGSCFTQPGDAAVGLDDGGDAGASDDAATE